MQDFPLQPHSLSIALADQLRARILSHQLPPGSDIHEGLLAQEFGVSRTPLREAMKLLCHEGLLTALPRRGMKVTLLSHAEVAEARLVCQQLQMLLERILPFLAGGFSGDDALAYPATDCDERSL